MAKQLIFICHFEVNKKANIYFIEFIVTNCPKHLTDSDVGALMRIFDNITKPNVCAFKKAM